ALAAAPAKSGAGQPPPTPPASGAAAAAATRYASNRSDLLRARGEGLAPLSSVPFAPAALFFQSPPIATYAGDCSTLKNSFNLGDTVCVKVSGAPTDGAAVVLSDPDNFKRDSLNVIANSQS